ncbi:ABC transporter ATP-binding protein [Lactobacillus terrae]|uniref:ABC transporter ATP-binding protein n=1 Tax=Lactobacillus terrae TaxID=2269374 RepID=UPI00147663E5|nr:ATP-binding cassette domain-containing protein [Lactobacillus terrae]
MRLLTIKDLSLQNEGYFAFKHVTFSLSSGESILINGENGSGKTQLIEAIAKMKNTDGGRVHYEPGINAALMPQYTNMVVNKKVGSYLSDSRKLAGKNAINEKQLEDIVGYLGLATYLDRNVSSLSVGIRRRVEFLNATVGRPKILLLDEPFAFQSPKYVERMTNLINDLKSNGSAIVVVSTMQNQATLKLFERRYLLKNKSLESIEDQITDCILTFRTMPDSMAITREINSLIISQNSSLIELKVPLRIKDRMIKNMIDLNYQFEGERIVED